MACVSAPGTRADSLFLHGKRSNRLKYEFCALAQSEVKKACCDVGERNALRRHSVLFSDSTIFILFNLKCIIPFTPNANANVSAPA